MSWDVYAIKYAERIADASEFFLKQPATVTGPQPMAYYVWVVKRRGEVILVDTGFNETAAAARGRPTGLSLGASLGLLGISLAEVTQTVLTHLHYDHAGNVSELPNSRFVLQSRELAFWSTPMSKRKLFASAMDDSDLELVQQLIADGRCELRDGDSEISTGVTVHHLGGHTPGHQVVRVNSHSSNVVLASDAVHTSYNLKYDVPSRTLADVIGVMAGFDRLRELASEDRLIIPGHDARVLTDFPAADPELVGIVARIS
jgi:glyoxylase-like metal-dependent hydrolase (beta-lactamase superfamily II)